MAEKTTEQMLRAQLERNRARDIGGAIAGGLFLLLFGYLAVMIFIIH